MKKFGFLIIALFALGSLDPSGPGIGIDKIWAQQNPPSPGDPEAKPNPPQITSQTGDAIVPPEAIVTFEVVAAGEGQLTYQWFFNGSIIRGANQSALTIRRAQPKHVGSYYAIVSNQGGRVRSRIMNLVIRRERTTGIGFPWATLFEGQQPGCHRPEDVVTDGSGNAYVVGEAPSAEGHADMAILKFDRNGNQLWALLLNPSQGRDDRAQRIVLHPNGNLIVIGTAAVSDAPPSAANPPSRLIALSISPEQEIVWRRELGGESIRAAEAIDLALAPNGDILVAGTALGPRNRDIAIFRLNANGRPLWAETYDNGGHDTAAAITSDRRGNSLVVGTSHQNGDDIIALYYGPRGNQIWNQRFTSEDNRHDQGVDALFDRRDRPVIVGALRHPSSGLDFFIAGYTPQGNERFRVQESSRGNVDDIPVGASIDSANAVLIAGNARGNRIGSEAVALKVSPQGSVLWSQLIPASLHPGRQVTAVIGTPDDGIIIAGGNTTESFGVDLFNIKLSSSGDTLWNASPRFNQQGRVFDIPTAGVLDPRGDLILVGVTNRGPGNNGTDIAAQTQMVILKQQITPPSQNNLPAVRILQPTQGQTFEFEDEVNIIVTASDQEGPIELIEILVGNKVIASSNTVPLATTWVVDRIAPLLITARVTDSDGAVVSSRAPFETVVTDISPVIVSFPESQTVTPGTRVALSPEVTGREPMRFQWLRNGQRIPRATELSLVIEEFNNRHAGHYQLLVENKAGRAKSPAITLDLDVPRVIPRDNFADRQLLAGESGQVRFSNQGATREPGEPGHAGKRSGRSVWFAFVAPAPGLATLETTGANFDTLLAVYTGDSLGNLDTIASDEDGAGFLTSSLTFKAESDQEYIVVVDGFNQSEGTAILTWSLDRTITVAIPRFVVEPVETVARWDSSVTFTASTPAPRPDGIDLQWYLNGAPIEGATGPQLRVDNIRARNVGRYWVVATLGNREARSREATLALAARRAVNAEKITEVKTERKFADIFLAFAQPNAQAVRTRRRPIPLAAALATGFSGAQIFNTFGAVKELGEPDHCDVPGGASQWFAYQAPIDGTVGMSTDGSDFDTVLAVYKADSADFTSLTEVACDNDSGIDGSDSVVSFEASADTIYYVVVDGVDGATGTVQIAYAMDLPLELNLTAVSGGSFGDQAITEFTYTVAAAPNVDFVIESSTDMIIWTSVLTGQANEEGIFEFTDTQFTLETKERYFRVFYP